MRKLIDPVSQMLVERRGLSRRAANHLSLAGTTIAVEDGQVLCRKGDRGLEAFVIADGTATVLTDDGAIELGPGDVVGELATLDPSRVRNATVVASSPGHVVVYDVRTFRALTEDEELSPVLQPARAA
ncbi:MAG TPA: cyclic nucleotide-binding domain-containing protein [Acidimicrobiales bacterium]|jgi:CRP-like cAMP-binding protein|nr:cyclic nucleotide-binding domain-containing protein [Acidimicrobiales bacterium]